MKQTLTKIIGWGLATYASLVMANVATHAIRYDGANDQILNACPEVNVMKTCPNYIDRLKQWQNYANQEKDRILGGRIFIPFSAVYDATPEPLERMAKENL